MHIKRQHPIAPPHTTNVHKHEYLVATKPGMTQILGNFGKGARFGCTLGLVHAYWYIWDSGGHNFLATRCFGDIHTSACSRGSQLHVDMRIIAIHQELRKFQRLVVLIYFP